MDVKACAIRVEYMNHVVDVSYIPPFIHVYHSAFSLCLLRLTTFGACVKLLCNSASSTFILVFMPQLCINISIRVLTHMLCHTS